MLIFTDIESIYFKTTRQYFQEVIKCYEAGSYRSVIVMLYATAVCDLIYKLQELNDIYEDKKAGEILNHINAMQNGDDINRARWESELIDRVHKETELLDDYAYTKIKHLKDERNFCAHPAINMNYELVSPNKEDVIAYIRSLFELLFQHPPYISNKIIDQLTDDISEKQSIFWNQDCEFKRYMLDKYYNRMSLPVKKRVFKSLWKFCFNKVNNEQYVKNRNINIKALGLLYDCNSSSLSGFINNDNTFTNVSLESDNLKYFCEFLAKYPNLYLRLNEDIKLAIDSLIADNGNIRLISWFKYDDLNCYFSDIKSDYYILNEVSREIYDLFLGKMISEGYRDEVLCFSIDYYGKSPSYSETSTRYYNAIKPNLCRFSKTDFIRIIEYTNDNHNIYGRWYVENINTEIINAASEILPDDFDLSIYPNFKQNKIAIL